MLLFLACLIQSIKAHAECLREVNGDKPKPVAAAAAARAAVEPSAAMGFASVWRAAKRWGKEGWVLKAESKKEVLASKVRPI